MPSARRPRNARVGHVSKKPPLNFVGRNRRPIRQQRDGGGFDVVGGLNYEVFCVGADVEADLDEVWEIELE